nr:hypothetical protein [Rubellimicrobium rubrum]
MVDDRGADAGAGGLDGGAGCVAGVDADLGGGGDPVPLARLGRVVSLGHDDAGNGIAAGRAEEDGPREHRLLGHAAHALHPDKSIGSTLRTKKPS